ncbi:Hypothetical predicted protein [Paramuricea clavata]|uniref:Uncharacterized protein n=1 Tax=Paramuricea clavata TaxID=317549 RepID=A0A6S7FEN1_PARCT|nr:Hypothetical predicted protein [Paramuricea clavata]
MSEAVLKSQTGWGRWAVFLLSYVGIVWVGVNCAQLSCHSCKTLLQTNQTPAKCNRTVENCDIQNSFCGILLWYKENAGVIYQESCVPHDVCRNVTAGCPKKSCYLYCCSKDQCNMYDQVNQSIDNSLASIMKEHPNMVPTEPASTKTVINESTTLPTNDILSTLDTRPPCLALASLLKCSRLTMVLLLTVIFLKDYIEI